jgi:THO complex subunit 4
VYTRRSDAFAALKRYNNVLLDGRPMRIEIVGTNADVPVSARVNVTGVNGRRKRTVVMTYVIILSLSLSLSPYIYIYMLEHK